MLQPRDLLHQRVHQALLGDLSEDLAFSEEEALAPAPGDADVGGGGLAGAVPRARVIDQTEGLLKAVVDAQSGAILGCALHCAEAGEMINTVEAAIRAGKDYTFLRDMIFTHPSMTEALNDLFGKIS